MVITALFASLFVSHASAATGDPLLDLGVQAYGGVGYAVARGDGTDILGRVGGGIMGWVFPRVGLGVRVDYGSYALLGDESAAFSFAESRFRLPEQDLALGFGVGRARILDQVVCYDPAGCPEVWDDYATAILVTSLTWEQGLGPLHMPLALRIEASNVRVGLGVDLGLGYRFRRR